MMTLSKLKSTRGSKPFTCPVKVKVCGVGNTSKYTTDKGESKESTVIGLADAAGAMKAIVYDSSKLAMCKDDSSIMLLNYIYKSDPHPTVVITNKTKVMLTSSVVVPEAFKTEAELIANPPPAQCVPLKLVKTSPVKSLISVKGKVVSEEIVKTVQVRGSEVHVKGVQIRDGVDDLKVSLWRDLSKKNLMGQYVQLTNVLVNSYKDEVSVSTTARTQIEACQEPSTEVTGDLIGFDAGDVTCTVMLESRDQFDTYEVLKDMLCSTLDCSSSDLDRTLQGKLPLPCRLVVTEGTCHISYFVVTHCFDIS